MGDNCHSKSDNIDMQRLYLKVNPRVVSAVYPCDRAVSQPLHNKPNTDELMANLALIEMDLIHIARSSCKDSSTHCSPSARP